MLQLLARNPEAEECYTQGLALAEALHDQPALARCLVELGKLSRIRSDYPEALHRLEKARTIYQAQGDVNGQARALWGLGGIYWSQLDYPSALRCFEDQLEMARGMGNQYLVAAALGSMGVVYMEQGDYARALDCYIQRLHLDVQLGDRLRLAKTIGNMGIVYADQGAYEPALICYQWLLQVTLELNDRQNVCVAPGNMIAVYADLEQWETAEHLAEQALTLCRVLNNPLYLTEYLYTSADLFARQKKDSEAVSLNDEAIRLATQIGRTDILLPARLLSIRLRVRMSQVDTQVAFQELEGLLAEWPESVQQAAILFERWQIDPAQETDRQEAAALYREAYLRSPKILYRQRYLQLTQDEIPTGNLPSPPALPALPEVVKNNPASLEFLLAQVDQLIANIRDNISQ